MKKSSFHLTLLLALSLAGLRCQDRHVQSRSHLAPLPAWVIAPTADAMPGTPALQADAVAPRARAHKPASLLLNDGDQWMQAYGSSPEAAYKDGGLFAGQRDLTDSIKAASERHCALRLIVEGNKVTAVFGIGLAEVLDDIGDSNQKQGSARPSQLDPHQRPRPRVNTELALAGTSLPDLSMVAPLATTAKDMVGSPAWNPSCHCENLGRRVIYKERALYLVDGDTQKLWVNLAGLNCEFCLDRINGAFRITAENPACASVFHCDASMRCHW